MHKTTEAQVDISQIFAEIKVKINQIMAAIEEYQKYIKEERE